MSYGSTYPDAVTALLAMLRTSPDLADVLVNDGAGLTDSNYDDVLSVGYVDSADDTAAEASISVEGAGGQQDRESYQVHCAISTVNGDNDTTACRARVFALLAVVGSVLRADPTLRGVVMNASVSSWTHRQDQTNAQAFSRLRFDVDIDAYTRK